jgi:hypothetical protein
MIYDSLAGEAPLDQGDIIEGCPVLHIAAFKAARLLAGDLNSLEIASNFCRVIVVTQTCDLANEKTTLAIVARMHEAGQLVQQGILKAAEIRGPVRATRVYGWYYLPESQPHGLPESIVDLRQLHTVRLDLLAALSQQGKRPCRLLTPYREHLAQHLATTYARIGLPLPYETSGE